MGRGFSLDSAVIGGRPWSQLVFVVAKLGEGHFPSELHHLPEHLLCILLFDQPLVDVADIGEEVAHRCDSVSTVGRHVVIAGRISKLDSVLAGFGLTAQGTFSTRWT